MYGFGQNPDSILLREILKIISQASCEGGIKKVISLITGNFGKILLMFVIQYYLKNTSKIPEFLFSFFRSIFYRKIKLDMMSRNTELYTARRLENNIEKEKEYNCFPLYFHKDKQYGIFEYIPVIQSRYYYEVKELAKSDFKEHVEKSSKIRTDFQNLNEKRIIPKKLFSSWNYLHLNEVISSYFQIAEMTEIYSTKGILINGEPGLGKTGCVDYLASLNSYQDIIKIDMTTQLEVSFDDIIKQILKKKMESVIILFDELDKYLSFNIRNEYDKMKNSILQKEGDKLEIAGIVTPWKEYVISRKERFLFELLSILENNFFIKGAVFIFCSNNFDTIFEDVNPVHFHSFKKRFLPIKFNRCQKKELKEYLRFYNSKFEGSKWYRSSDILEKEMDKLKEDISITYRDISDLNISSCYMVEKFIHSINEFIEEKQNYFNIIQEEENDDLEYSDNEKNIDKICVLKKDIDSIKKEKVIKSNSDFRVEIMDGISDDENDEKYEDEIKDVIDIEEIKDKIRYYLDKCNEIDEIENSIPFVIELFEYMEKPECILFLKKYPNFKKTLVSKFEEYKQIADHNYPEYKERFEIASKNILDETSCS